MKNNLPKIVIIASVIVLIGNFVFSEKFNLGYWLTTVSMGLIIIAMVLTIRTNRKQDKN